MASDGARLRREYRGLLVDWGGVMTSNVFDTFRAFCEGEGLSPEKVGELFRHDPTSRELLIGLETGALPEEEFEPRFAAVLGVPAPHLIDRLFAGGRPDEAMLTRGAPSAREQGIRTGLISNSWGTRRYDRPLLAELFDGVVISGEVGMRKPEPEIYSLGAERIGLEPQRLRVTSTTSAFNLKPAAAMGMATVHHTERRRDDPRARAAARRRTAMSRGAASGFGPSRSGCSPCSPWRGAGGSSLTAAPAGARATQICNVAARRMNAIPTPGRPAKARQFVSRAHRRSSRELTARAITRPSSFHDAAGGQGGRAGRCCARRLKGLQAGNDPVVAIKTLQQQLEPVEARADDRPGRTSVSRPA